MWSACFPTQAFESQSIERINFLRNSIWTHLNQLSQQCVTSDEVTFMLKSMSEAEVVFFFFLIVHDEMSWNCVKATVQHLSAHYLAFVSSVSGAMHVDTVAVWGSEKVSGTVWRPARHYTLYKPEVDCRETTRYDCGNFSSSPACMCVSVSVCLEKIWLKI